MQYAMFLHINKILSCRDYTCNINIHFQEEYKQYPPCSPPNFIAPSVQSTHYIYVTMSQHSPIPEGKSSGYCLYNTDDMILETPLRPEFPDISLTCN